MYYEACFNNLLTEKDFLELAQGMQYITYNNKNNIHNNKNKMKDLDGEDHLPMTFFSLTRLPILPPNQLSPINT